MNAVRPCCPSLWTTAVLLGEGRGQGKRKTYFCPGPSLSLLSQAPDLPFSLRRSWLHPLSRTFREVLIVTVLRLRRGHHEDSVSLQQRPNLFARPPSAWDQERETCWRSCNGDPALNPKLSQRASAWFAVVCLWVLWIMNLL